MTKSHAWISYLLSGLAVSSYCPAQLDAWPVVKSVVAERVFGDLGSGGDTPFQLIVRNISGNSIYKLECHNGDYDSVVGFNYSGDFHCALFALKSGKIFGDDLLATKDEARVGRDWYNRGRMLARQLSMSCGASPEYGAIRHFRLRGMLITFYFDELRWFPIEQFHRVRLSSFRFRVSFEPDVTANTAVAAPVRELRPSKSCGW